VRGAALAKTGQVHEGLAELGRGIGAHTGMQATAYQPFVLTLWAEGLLAAARHAEALDAVNRAIAISEAQGERFYAAELRRVKGEALAKSGDFAGAQRCLHEAVEIARRQQARLFELRGAQVARGLVAPK
jgi:tetratricopeptide (TPR) repeat protein